jgi:DNA-binding SARP family transcriptional activator
MTEQRGTVRLEVLGGVALHAGGTEARAVLAQPKRLAVLVWMTLHRAGGWVRRDELLATFWPDTPPERARVTLRQAVQYLRRHLGDDVVRRRGDVELGVDPVRLRCDALEFLAAVARGDDAGAIGIYSGELLAGFALHDTDAFDRWLHTERQRLRTMAAQSALRAATYAAEAGDMAAARRWTPSNGCARTW